VRKMALSRVGARGSANDQRGVLTNDFAAAPMRCARRSPLGTGRAARAFSNDFHFTFTLSIAFNFHLRARVRTLLFLSSVNKS